MLDEVRRFIRRERMLKEGEPVWVAVSGGIDSMVLLHVLQGSGHACSVAHVDHGLRGQESDADRRFVEEHCRTVGLPFRALRADVKAHAEENDLSVQLAGRWIRYDWLGGLWRERPMPIAMGHHADDAVESLMINLMRGTGVHGWSAIRPISGIYVRPLLCVGREAITRFATDHRIPYREDPSNSDVKYLRNRIRHTLLPLMEEMRPGAIKAMSRSIGLLRELEEAGQQLSIAALAGIAPTPEGSLRIPFDRVEASLTPDLVLHRLLRHAGFHPSTLDRIRDAIRERATGAVFTSGDQQVCVDRDALLVSRIRTDQPVHVIERQPARASAGEFTWEVTEGSPPAPPLGAFEAALDADRLSFPLELRPWREGDRIRPMGMDGSKRVSDILIDAKVPRPAKAGVHVLVSDGTVVWVCGHRIAQGFQLTPATRSVFHIRQGPGATAIHNSR